MPFATACGTPRSASLTDVPGSAAVMILSLASIRARLATLAAGALLRAGAPLFNLAMPKRGCTLRPSIAYGKHPRHRLDICMPGGLRAPAPVLIFFYGGTWQTGA